MGGRLRTQLPVLPSTLVPRNLLREREEVAKKEEIYRSNQYSTGTSSLTTGESVWIRDQDRLGKVQGHTQHPRSYLIEIEKGIGRRNRSALVKTGSQSTPVIADNQATLTSSASDLPVHDWEGHSAGAFHFPDVTSKACQKQPVCRESALTQTRFGRIVRPSNQLNL